MGREQSIDITEKRQAATLKIFLIFQPESDEAVMETHFSKQIASIREESIFKKCKLFICICL